MKIQFTFKHMESSQALADLAEEKFTAKIERLTTRPVHAHVTFSVQGLLQKIHVTLLTADGRDIEAEHEGMDMYAEIDIVAEKLEGQLRRHKEKLKSHKGATARGLTQAIHATIGEQVAFFHDGKLEVDTAIDAAEILDMEKARRPLSPVCNS